MEGEEEVAPVAIGWTDRVRVRRGSHYPTSILSHQTGLMVGDWYVIQNLGPDAIRDRPDTNFDVGHGPSGMKIWGGLTFWEARRIALALDDADLFVPVTIEDVDDDDLDDDLALVVDAIIASALMDHYVFPLGRYLCG